ncbi:hypothetical protein [Spirosoma aerolatum]|uniref:hypothetical protein n=1 Tax=Spirosoma aerolatum TaxID=1211326 RepID=UPI0009AE2916|nr:hypothetical protein [Spirosoma aerolatum]
MNTLIAHIDEFVVSLALLLTLLNTVRLVRGASLPVRRLPAALVVLGPTANATLMGAGHLFENSYHAVERLLAGTYTYNFRQYSLFLMGVVMLAISLYILRQLSNWFSGIPGSERKAVQATLAIVAVSAPTIAFTPIGILPTLVSFVSLLAHPFVMKNRPSSVSALATEMRMEEPIR